MAFIHVETGVSWKGSEVYGSYASVIRCSGVRRWRMRCVRRLSLCRSRQSLQLLSAVRIWSRDSLMMAGSSVSAITANPRFGLAL